MVHKPKERPMNPSSTASDAFVLAGDFDTPTQAQWEAEVVKVLNRGRPPGSELTAEQALKRLRSHTIDDFDIEPLYTRDDRELGYPGVAPFVRGTTVKTGAMDAWDVRQLFENPDPSATRAEVLEDLARGVTSVWLRVGADGIAPEALGEALAGVKFDLASVVVSSVDDQDAAASALVDAWRASSVDPTAVTGNLGLDAIGLASVRGTKPDLSAHRLWVERVLADLPGVRAITVDVTGYHDAGASDADELGFAIATGVAYLRDLLEAGFPPAVAFGQIEFRVSATADQFATIARMRALRRLWARVGEVAGVPEAERGAIQHAVTSWRMVSRDDPWVNMLRTTAACFAAAVGGAEAITVLPFDAAVGLPNQLSRRVARNTQLVLAEESNIGRVNDPAGGSWYVESLTDALAEAGWAVAQQIDAAADWAAASALVVELIEASVAERNSRLAHRKLPLTGVSMFPNPGEEPLVRDAAPQRLAGGLTHRRDSEMFEELRDRAASADPLVFLAALGSRRDFGGRLMFTENLLAVAGIGHPASEGGSIDEMLAAFKASGTSVAVLCSSAKVYASQAAEAAAALRGAGATKVLLAGSVKELGEDASVVDGSLFAGMDVVTFLSDLLDDLGVSR